MKSVFNSAEQTYEFGRNLAAKLCGGEIILLFGEMGCGKTVFTKGLGRGLGIDREILSPTFTLMNEYNSGRLKLYHFDAYRLSDVSQAEEIGLTEYFGATDSVCVIEWPEVLLPLLKSYDCIKIYFSYLDDNSREVIYDE